MPITRPGAKSRYDKLKVKRDPYHERAKEFSSLTIPSVMPVNDADWGGDGKLDLDWQSFGAHVVNFVTNKYVTTLLPSGRPFARLDLPEEARKQLDMTYGAAAVQFFLSMTERKAFVKAFEALGAREVFTEWVQHCIVTGNGLLYEPPDTGVKDAMEKGIRFYALNQYVVRRNKVGKVLELITEDQIDAYSMPEEARKQLRANGVAVDNPEDDALHYLYTYSLWDPDQQKYIVTQAVDELEIGEIGNYKAEDFPYMVGVFNLSRNEHYGRGWVELQSGNFNALSILMQSIAEGAVAISDIKYLVDPSSGINVKELNESSSGAYVGGKPESVKPIQASKLNDLQFVHELVNSYKQDIALSALMSSAATRDAERVTAEEIRVQARELETGHAGVYTTMANLLLKPLARRLLKKTNPKLFGAGIEVLIVTGLEALGRSDELESMRLFFSDLSLLQNVPEEMRGAFKANELVTDLAAMHGIDYTRWVKSAEEQADEATAQRQNAAFQQLMDAGTGGLEGMLSNVDPNTIDPGRAASIMQTGGQMLGNFAQGGQQ